MGSKMGCSLWSSGFLGLEYQIAALGAPSKISSTAPKVMVYLRHVMSQSHAHVGADAIISFSADIDLRPPVLE